MSRSAGHLVLYDAECRFCRWSLAWLLRWDRARRLEPVALQDERAAALLGGMPESERLASWHLVGREGAVSSKGAAVPTLLRLLPGGAPLAALAERFPAAVERGYARVASVRGRIGDRLGDGALRRADTMIAQRKPGPRREG